MNTDLTLDPAFSLRSVTALGHFLWQGSLLALVSLAGEWLLVRAAAKWRYALHLTVLLLMAVCVPVTFLSSVPSTDPTSVSQVETRLQSDGKTERRRADAPFTITRPERIVGAEWVSAQESGARPIAARPATIAAKETRRSDQRSAASDQLLLRLATPLLLAWFTGVAVMLLRLCHGAWGGNRLRRESQAIQTGPLHDFVVHQSKLLRIRCEPTIAWCREISVPVVVGIARPIVLLPACAATGMTVQQIEALILHELTHIRRFDLLVNLLQRVVESVLFFHPAVWYVSRRVSRERELACDEFVIQSHCPPTVYADSLLRMAELSAGSHSLSVPTASLAASGRDSSEIKRRILNVLGMPSTSRYRPGRIVLLLTVGMAALAVVLPVWLRGEPAANAQPPADASTLAAESTEIQPVEVENPLERPVSLSLQDISLRTVIGKLAEQAGLQATFDEAALRETGLDPNESVSVSVENVPLTEALSQVVHWRLFPGAMYRIHGDRLVVTTLNVWQARLKERLPDWLKPLQNNGLLAGLDDENHVVSITASGEGVTDDLLEKIATLPHLRDVHLEVSTNLTRAGVAHLGLISNLNRLSLYNISADGSGLGDDAIRAVAGVPSLTELSIAECGTTDTGAKLLEQLPQLTSLSFRQEGRLTDRALLSIGKLTGLQSLSLNSYVGNQQLGWMRFSADAMRQLQGLSELRSLHVVGQEVPPEAVSHPKLTALSLGHGDVGDDVAGRVGTLKALRSLELSYTGITDSGFSAIARLPELQRLDISSRLLTDSGIKHLAGHNRLQHISLRVSGVTDASLETLAGIQTLRRLDLSGSGGAGVAPGRNFTPEGLTSLSRLPKLSSLYLNNFRTDGGYSALKNLTQLHELNMMMCDVTDVELEALEDALPNTFISHVTGGWSWIPRQLRNRRKLSASRQDPDAPVDNAKVIGSPAQAESSRARDTERVASVAAPSKPESAAGQDIKYQLFERYLARGGKISTDQLQAAITLVATEGARDAEFIDVLLKRFAEVCEAENSAAVNRNLLAVLIRVCGTHGSRRWAQKYHQVHPDQIPQRGLPLVPPGKEGVPPTKQTLTRLESAILVSLIKYGREADRSDIDSFTLAIRQLHHTAGRQFLLDVMRNPQTQQDPLADIRADPTGEEQGKWKDNIGGQWTDAKFTAAVGLAELGERAGFEWLLAQARPNDFGIDGSLWRITHGEDRRGSLRKSCHLALIDLLQLDSDTTFRQLNDRWRSGKIPQSTRPVSLKLPR